MIPPVHKVEALLQGITRRDLDLTAPALRLRLAAGLRRIADLADPPALDRPGPSGILADLRRGDRAD